VQGDLKEMEDRIMHSRTRKGALESGEISSVQETIRNLEKQQNQIQKLKSEIEQYGMKRDMIVSNISELEKNIEVYEGDFNTI
jgi:DNA repair exonuclease SbcCD ATPase subunit